MYIHFSLNAVVCNRPCENGACVANDTCACSEGFIGNTCDEIGEPQTHWYTIYAVSLALKTIINNYMAVVV